MTYEELLEEFLIYMKLVEEMTRGIKDFIKDEEYFDAVYSLGQLNDYVHNQVDLLEVLIEQHEEQENGCENKENTKD